MDVRRESRKCWGEIEDKREVKKRQRKRGLEIRGMAGSLPPISWICSIAGIF